MDKVTLLEMAGDDAVHAGTFRRRLTATCRGAAEAATRLSTHGSGGLTDASAAGVTGGLAAAECDFLQDIETGLGSLVTEGSANWEHRTSQLGRLGHYDGFVSILVRALRETQRSPGPVDDTARVLISELDLLLGGQQNSVAFLSGCFLGNLGACVQLSSRATSPVYWG